jgi:hypothetical protein
MKTITAKHAKYVKKTQSELNRQSAYIQDIFYDVSQDTQSTCGFMTHFASANKNNSRPLHLNIWQNAELHRKLRKL